MQAVSLQGNVYLATRDANGNPGVFRHVGNAPAIEITPEVNNVERFESTSGQRLQAGRLQLGKTMNLSLTLDEWTKENLALALYGTSATIASGNVTGEALPTGVAQNDYVRLANQDVSSVVINDSAGTPAQLVEGTDYEITSAKHGTIKIIGDLSGYTAPFDADYDFAGGINVAMFDAAPVELWMMVDGVNTAQANLPVKAELYRVLFDPVGSLALIHNDGYGQFELSGSALYDDTKVGDATLGQFGRMIEMAA